MPQSVGQGDKESKAGERVDKGDEEEGKKKRFLFARLSLAHKRKLRRQ